MCTDKDGNALYCGYNCPVTDHTAGGNGLFLFINDDSGDPNKSVVWQYSATTIRVTGGATYRFQAYLATITYIDQWTAQPYLSFHISSDGGQTWAPLGISPQFSDGCSGWQQIFADYVAQSTTTVMIRLVNSQYGGGGNDYAVDDVYFGLATAAPGYSASATPSPTPSTTTTLTTTPTRTPSSAYVIGDSAYWYIPLGTSRTGSFTTVDNTVPLTISFQDEGRGSGPGVYFWSTAQNSASFTGSTTAQFSSSVNYQTFNNLAGTLAITLTCNNWWWDCVSEPSRSRRARLRSFACPERFRGPAFRANSSPPPPPPPHRTPLFT